MTNAGSRGTAELCAKETSVATADISFSLWLSTLTSRHVGSGSNSSMEFGTMTATGFDNNILGDTPDFGWLEHELNFLKQDGQAESPRNTEHSGGSPRSITGAVETDPIIRTPGSEGDGSSYFRRDSVANIEEKPLDDVFIKPPIPDRLKAKQQPFTKSPFHDDMSFLSNTFQTSNGYSTDSPAGVLETTYGLVLGPFFHQLLRLYFQNIHPYYPVIDEFDFDACFAEPIEDEGLRNSRACVLGVMLLCASMYLNARQLFGYSRWTQHSLQQFTFRAVKELYDKYTEADDYSLTQACMLLSYWSPCYAEPRHNCGEWIQKAFVHAKKANIDQTTSGAITDRSRLIWVSCILRDRALSYAGRRPLHPYSTRPNWIRVDREDFGLEICLPRYSNITSRTETVDAFLVLCRLSEIFADLGEFQEKLRPKLQDPEFELGRKDILRISQFDIRIREWIRGFKHWKAGPHTPNILDTKGVFYLWSIVGESATASLYLPFIKLGCKTDPLASKFQATAMGKLKDSSAKAAETVREFLMDVKPEEMPPFMGNWLTLPIIVLLVSLKCRGPGGSGSSEAASDIQRLRYLLSALRVFQTRYRSAKFIREVLDKVSKDFQLGVWDAASSTEAPVIEDEASLLIKTAVAMIEGFRNDTTGASQR